VPISLPDLVMRARYCGSRSPSRPPALLFRWHCDGPRVVWEGEAPWFGRRRRGGANGRPPRFADGTSAEFRRRRP